LVKKKNSSIHEHFVYCWLCSALQKDASGLSGLCPSSYPRLVMDSKTGQCFETGSQGFCGKLAMVASNPLSPNFAMCRCRQNYLDKRRECFGRPLISYGNRCYFEFSQVRTHEKRVHSCWCIHVMVHG
jgi:hypothetical protein